MKKSFLSLLLLFSMIGFSLANKSIILSPGRNVVSTPKTLSGINFSNGGAGVSFYTLSGASWASIIPTPETIKPLDGFVVNNSTSGNVIMSLLYKTNLSPMETLFQKTLNVGRNLLGITTVINPFTNIGNSAVMSVDFTKSISSNLLNLVNNGFTLNNLSSNVASPELGEAYGVFVTSSGAIYGGSQDLNNANNNVDLSGIVLTKTTTGSKTVAPDTNVILFEGKINSNDTFDVSNYTLSFTTGASNIATDFVGGKVTAYINGVDYEITTGTTIFSATADAFRIMSANDVVVRVVGNVLPSAETGVNYKIKLILNKVKDVFYGTEYSLGDKSLEGDTITIDNSTYTVTKPTTIPNNKTVLEGSASDVLYFNLRANAENQVLKSIRITSTTGFNTYASKVALMQGTTEVKSFTNETDLTTGALLFDTLSTSLTKDTTVPFTVRVTLKAGEVVNLGNSITVSLAATNVVRSSNQTIATTTSATFPFVGNAYQIASSVPTVALPSQDGKNTVISFASTSNYDVEIFTGTVEFTRNLVNGAYVNWAGTVKVLDSINGTAVGTGLGTAPGSITLGFTNLTVDTASVDRVLELVDAANTVTDADYTVTVKNVTFRYVDRNDPAKKSAVINESYNIAR